MPIRLSSGDSVERPAFSSLGRGWGRGVQAGVEVCICMLSEHRQHLKPPDRTRREEVWRVSLEAPVGGGGLRGVAEKGQCRGPEQRKWRPRSPGAPPSSLLFNFFLKKENNQQCQVPSTGPVRGGLRNVTRRFSCMEKSLVTLARDI